MTDVPGRLAAALAGRYTIEGELGEGGMATVYLAEDLKHSRKVAIKVLRPELAAVIGAERFLSEIKTTANLQHPHILPLFDSGEADGFLFYVMPYVEGESLRDRLSRDKQLPLADAVRIAREVADGLDYAHRRSVVHRDIKPENVLLHDGRAVIADFGIALAASKAGESRMTQTGMSLGTPSYMSPEQAMGDRDIGPRSDIYALGAMTYEMLVGDPPFTGSTAQAIVAKAMTEKPMPPSRLRDTIPIAVEDAVLTALQKLPADRFATAKEFADALTSDVTGSRTATRALPSIAVSAGPWKRVSGLLGACALGLLALSGWALTRRASATGPSVYDVALPDSAPMAFAATKASTSFGSVLRSLSVSASGDVAVYVAQHGATTSIWLRHLRDATATQIAGTSGASAPRISPDGSRVAFYTTNRVAVIPVTGGEPRTLLEGPAPTLIEWISPTTLLAANQDGFRLVWIDPEVGQTRNKAVARCIFGRWIPEEKRLICRVNGFGVVVDPETGQGWTLHATAADGGDGPPVAGSGFRVVGGDLLVYISMDGELRAASYDARAHRIGRPVPLLKGVRAEALGDAQYDITDDGTLVYAPGLNAEMGHIVRLRPGAPAQMLSTDRAAYQRFDLSPDRRWLAAVVQTADEQELRIYDTRDGQRTVWLRGELIRQPLWNPGSDRLLALQRNGQRFALMSGAPGSGRAPDTLVAGDSAAGIPDVVDFHDEHRVLAQDWYNSVAMRFDPSVRPFRLDTLLTEARFVTIAPGGRLMAYMGTQGGAVAVTSHPVPGRRWQIAADGVEPQWLSAGELLYRSGTAWYIVRLDPSSGEPRGPSTEWARDPRFSDTAGWSNRLSHDGGILYVQGPEQTTGSFLRVVPNWVAQARAAVTGASR
jgi:serine/threonine protein kinase